MGDLTAFEGNDQLRSSKSANDGLETVLHIQNLEAMSDQRVQELFFVLDEAGGSGLSSPEEDQLVSFGLGKRVRDAVRQFLITRFLEAVLAKISINHQMIDQRRFGGCHPVLIEDSRIFLLMVCEACGNTYRPEGRAREQIASTIFP